MFVEKDFIDPTKPYVKLVMVDGQPRQVTVLPPAPEPHDETVWPVSRAKQSGNFQPHVYDGLGALQEYATTYADQHS